MILTQDYLPVLASFNHPPDFNVETEDVSSEKKDTGFIFYNFYVGPYLEYRIDLEGEDGTWGVSFFLNAVTGSREDLAQYFSKIFRKNVTPYEAENIRYQLLSHSTDDLNLGNAPEVFSNVMAIIKELIENYTVECLTFMSDSKKKASVYRRLFLRYLRGWFPVMDTGRHFKVCRMDD